jgi:uncharacterized protein (TIGR00369 family)
LKLPPYAALLGASIESEDGTAAPVLAMPFGDDVTGRPGFVHGGALAGLLELAAITALEHALAAESRGEAGFKPVNVTVDFMRGGREKLTRAQGHVSRLGSRIANVEAVAWQDDRDRPVAAARMNFLISG